MANSFSHVLIDIICDISWLPTLYLLWFMKLNHHKNTCFQIPLGKDADRVVGQVVTRVVEAQTLIQSSDRLELIGGHIEAHDIQVLRKTRLAV